MRYTIFNPTPAVRVIHDGIEGSQRQTAIGPGQTRTGIELSDAVARELARRTRENKDADLQLTQESEQQPKQTLQQESQSKSSSGNNRR